MSKCGTLADPMFSCCLYHCQNQSALGDLRNVQIAMGFARGTLCVWKRTALATNSSDLPSHLPSQYCVNKQSFEKAQKESKDLTDSEDLEDLAKQTLRRSTGDDKVWVTYLRQQAGARKAAAIQENRSRPNRSPGIR